MSIIQITSILCSIPLIYPIIKFWKKKDFNLLDLLIIFLSVNFCILPFFYPEFLVVKYGVVFTHFYIFSLLIFPLLFLDMFWTRNCSERNSVINIVRVFKGINKFHITPIGYLIIFLALFFIYTLYLPYTSVTFQFEEQGIQYTNRTLKVYLLILSAVNLALEVVIYTNFIIKLKFKNLNWIDISLLILMILATMFLRRRDFIFSLLIFVIIYYSLCRERINKKSVFLITVFSFLIYFYYFPFFNVIRRAQVDIDLNKPVITFVNIVKYGFQNYQKNAQKAKDNTEKRTIGLYYATSTLIDVSPPIENGKIIWMEIDAALPKAINPNKGNGSEGYLAEITKTHTDIADSLLLESIADFGKAGGLICFFLYWLVLGLYSRYERFLYGLTGSSLMTLYITIAAFDVCWRVEGKLSGYLSWFFASALILVILFLLEKLKIMTLSSFR